MSGPIVKNVIELLDERFIFFNVIVSGHHIYTRRNVVVFGVQDTVQLRASNVVKLAVLVVGPISIRFTVSNRALRSFVLDAWNIILVCAPVDVEDETQHGQVAMKARKLRVNRRYVCVILMFDHHDDVSHTWLNRGIAQIEFSTVQQVGPVDNEQFYLWQIAILEELHNVRRNPFVTLVTERIPTVPSLDFVHRFVNLLAGR